VIKFTEKSFSESDTSFLSFGITRKTEIRNINCVVPCFRRDVNEICALLGFYAEQNGGSVRIFRDR